MKRVLVICLIISVSACASMSGEVANKTTSKKENSTGYDEKYMARIERMADQNGVVIKWVNPPKAPKAKKDGR